MTTECIIFTSNHKLPLSFHRTTVVFSYRESIEDKRITFCPCHTSTPIPTPTPIPTSTIKTTTTTIGTMTIPTVPPTPVPCANPTCNDTASTWYIITP